MNLFPSILELCVNAKVQSLVLLPCQGRALSRNSSRDLLIGMTQQFQALNPSRLRVLLFEVSFIIVNSGEDLATRWMVTSERALEMNSVDVTPEVFFKSKTFTASTARSIAFEVFGVCSRVFPLDWISGNLKLGAVLAYLRSQGREKTLKQELHFNF